MSDRPECAECPLSDAFDGLSDDLCCESDPTTPRCESCGVPLVKHLGLEGTCTEKERNGDEAPPMATRRRHDGS